MNISLVSLDATQTMLFNTLSLNLAYLGQYGSMAQWSACSPCTQEDGGSNPAPAALSIPCDIRPDGALYSVLYAEASKTHHTWGKCVTCCGLMLFHIYQPS